MPHLSRFAAFLNSTNPFKNSMLRFSPFWRPYCELLFYSGGHREDGFMTKGSFVLSLIICLSAFTTVSLTAKAQTINPVAVAAATAENTFGNLSDCTTGGDTQICSSGKISPDGQGPVCIVDGSEKILACADLECTVYRETNKVVCAAPSPDGKDASEPKVKNIALFSLDHGEYAAIVLFSKMMDSRTFSVGNISLKKIDDDYDTTPNMLINDKATACMFQFKPTISAKYQVKVNENITSLEGFSLDRTYLQDFDIVVGPVELEPARVLSATPTTIVTLGKLSEESSRPCPPATGHGVLTLAGNCVTSNNNDDVAKEVTPPDSGEGNINLSDPDEDARRHLEEARDNLEDGLENLGNQQPPNPSGRNKRTESGGNKTSVVGFCIEIECSLLDFVFNPQCWIDKWTTSKQCSASAEQKATMDKMANPQPPPSGSPSPGGPW